MFEAISGKIAAAMTIACLLQACSGRSSRLSETHGDPQSTPVMRQKAVATGKGVLPRCPGANISMLQESTPGTGHHKVFLSWNPSSSPDVGYCLYRRQRKRQEKKTARKISELIECLDCEQINLLPDRSTRCVDDLVMDETVYSYLVVAINSRGEISSPTNEALARVPAAKRQNRAPADSASYPACRAAADVTSP